MVTSEKWYIGREEVEVKENINVNYVSLYLNFYKYAVKI